MNSIYGSHIYQEKLIRLIRGLAEVPPNHNRQSGNHSLLASGGLTDEEIQLIKQSAGKLETGLISLGLTNGRLEVVGSVIDDVCSKTALEVTESWQSYAVGALVRLVMDLGLSVEKYERARLMVRCCRVLQGNSSEYLKGMRSKYRM